MKKLHKRSASKKEIAFAMSIPFCPQCAYQPMCNCPTYPTHQVVYGQKDSGKTLSQIAF